MPASTNHLRLPDYGRLLRTYAVELLLLALILYLCVSKGLTIGIDIYDPAETQTTHSAVSEAGLAPTGVLTTVWKTGVALLASFTENQGADAGAESADKLLVSSPVAVPAEPGYDDFNDVVPTDDPAPHLSNLTLVLSPDYGERKGLAPEIITAKKKRVTDYIDRYAAIAQREMRDFGIPASITLAQGILESNAGDSKLAVRSNNHFGIKCRQKCLGCTCRNYSDDSRYDMFRVFDSVAGSFREHSELLNTSRYAKLKAHGTDYKKWAHGLKSCGYATDKKYGHKLVKIIENLGLDRYDVAR